MGVYRGPGGTGESSSNTALAEVAALSNTVLQAKEQAEAAASSASASATASAASAASAAANAAALDDAVAAAQAAQAAAEAAQAASEAAEASAESSEADAEAAQAAAEAAEDALVNVYTRTEADTLLAAKANQSTTYTKTEVDSSLSTKQTTLVSGTNIKTVNSGSLLGSGDLVIEGVSSGSIIYFARNTAPTGYLKANGAAVSRTTYAALFAAIGTTFGAGDGSTTFLLPDLRGEFIRGWADGRAVDTGRAFGSFQDQAFASHSHSASIIANYSTAAGPFNFAGYAGSNGSFGSASTSSAGGAETRPRNVALLACIKF